MIVWRYDSHFQLSPNTKSRMPKRKNKIYCAKIVRKAECSLTPHSGTLRNTQMELFQVTLFVCKMRLNNIMEWILELHIEIILFVGIVIRWLIWLVGEEMKFGKEFCRDELSMELGLIHVGCWLGWPLTKHLPAVVVKWLRQLLHSSIYGSG